MSDKYEITSESKSVAGVTVYRIRALKSFGNVKKGEFGGFVESQSNLSQDNTCWISGEACAWSDARVVDRAVVSGNARVTDSAFVGGDAEISGSAYVYYGAQITGHAKVFGDIYIGGSQISEYAQVSGTGFLGRHARISGHAVISAVLGYWNLPLILCITDNAEIRGHCRGSNNSNQKIILTGNAKLYGDFYVRDVVMGGNAQIYGEASVANSILGGNVKIHGTANISGQTYIGNEDISS